APGRLVGGAQAGHGAAVAQRIAVVVPREVQGSIGGGNSEGDDVMAVPGPLVAVGKLRSCVERFPSARAGAAHGAARQPDFLGRPDGVIPRGVLVALEGLNDAVLKGDRIDGASVRGRG